MPRPEGSVQKHNVLSEGVGDQRSPQSCQCDREFSLSADFTRACGIIWQRTKPE